MARHAIGKFVHMHLASNEDARNRLLKLGEEPFRVYNVGAPQLDELVSAEFSTLEEVEKRLCVELTGGFILAVLHPVTEEYSKAKRQAEVLVKSLNRFDIPKIMILPNNDAGTYEIKYAIDNYKQGKYYIYANLKREDYLALLKYCRCIVGNSSSGLLEAPVFRTAAVNIGRRQDHRYRGNNVIDVNFSEGEIIDAVKKAMSKEFREYLLKNVDYPYGDGHSSEKVLKLLMETKSDERLLVKQLTY